MSKVSRWGDIVSPGKFIAALLAACVFGCDEKFSTLSLVQFSLSSDSMYLGQQYGINFTKHIQLLITIIIAISFGGLVSAQSEKKDIVDTAVGAGQFNTLVAGLVETLKGRAVHCVCTYQYSRNHCDLRSYRQSFSNAS